ncbi:MAG: LON peptidase substrate-binding domain-containing protein [Acidobacteriaceae bacterium]
MIERIPLFPLELVLFPEAALPLHIFEPCYREMIGDCLGRGREFGVVCAFPTKGPEFLHVGCTARIKGVLNEYQDGRLDILTHGVRRFRVRHTVDDPSRSYPQADVEWLPDWAEATRPFAERQRVVDLHNQLVMLAFEAGSTVDLRAPEDCEHLAFALAGMLPFDLAVKQAILENNSETRRLRLLANAYEELLLRAREIAHQVESPPKHVM